MIAGQGRSGDNLGSIGYDTINAQYPIFRSDRYMKQSKIDKAL